MVKKHLNPTRIDFVKCVVEDSLWQIRNTKTVDVPDIVEVWSVDIKPRESKSVISFIRSIQEDDPVSFLHVKRIMKINESRLRVLIASKEFVQSRKTFDELISEASFEYENIRDNNQVPITGPSTKSLMLKWSQEFWPLIWRGNPNDQILNDYIFDLAFIREILNMISKESRNIVANHPGKVPTVSAFVNPKNGEVLFSSDHRFDHSPLDHSTMVGIELVAKNEQERRDRIASGSGSVEDHREDTYLCLDFDFYTTHEPCSMCSMALIHSRIKRCIFIKPMSVSGALKPDSGDGYCMHANRGLNSNYEVFQWVGEDLGVPNIDPEICC